MRGVSRGHCGKVAPTKIFLHVINITSIVIIVIITALQHIFDNRIFSLNKDQPVLLKKQGSSRYGYRKCGIPPRVLCAGTARMQAMKQ